MENQNRDIASEIRSSLLTLKQQSKNNHSHATPEKQYDTDRLDACLLPASEVSVFFQHEDYIGATEDARAAYTYPAFRHVG